MNEAMLDKYARFTVGTAVNVQKGQTLVVNCPVACADFAHRISAAAFEAGAGDVVVHYNDEALSRIRLERAPEESLVQTKPWQLRRYLDYVEAPEGAAYLTILSLDPEAYSGLNAARVDAANGAARRALAPWRDLLMANRLPMGVAAVPNPAWARKVFPHDGEERAVEKLWNAILKACRMDAPDPDAAWQSHIKVLQKHRDWLQGLGLAALHFTAANGTDLTVGLADNHQWCCADGVTPSGVVSIQNVPTEEVFCAPHARRVDGVVKTSLPYVYNGELVENITVRFEKGAAVDYSAEKGEAQLRSMLATDDGALRLGEVALVPASSPVKKSGLLFYNTLFDENAACHIAFGAGYPSTIRGGEGLQKKTLAKHGLNQSLIHEDVMIGTDDMDVTGITRDGREIPVFRGGEWVEG